MSINFLYSRSFSIFSASQRCRAVSFPCIKKNASNPRTVRLYSSGKDKKHTFKSAFDAQRLSFRNRDAKDDHRLLKRDVPEHAADNEDVEGRLNRAESRSFGLGSSDARKSNGTLGSPLERLEKENAPRPGQKQHAGIRDIMDRLHAPDSSKVRSAGKGSYRSADEPSQPTGIPSGNTQLMKTLRSTLGGRPEQEGGGDGEVEQVDLELDDLGSDDIMLDESMIQERESARNASKYAASHQHRELPRYGKKSRPLRTIQAEYDLVDAEGEDFILSPSDYASTPSVETEGEDIDSVVDGGAADYTESSELPDEAWKDVPLDSELPECKIVSSSIEDADSSSSVPTDSKEESEDADSMKNILLDWNLSSQHEIRSANRLFNRRQTYSSTNEYIINSKYGLFQCVMEMFDRILFEKQWHTLIQNHKCQRAELRRAKSWDKRRAWIANEREVRMKNKKVKAQALAELKGDPNMVYYHELGCWMSRESLRNPMIRNAVSAVTNNPSWSRKDKKEFIDRIQRDIADLEKGPSEKVKSVLNMLTDFQVEEPPTATKDIDHLLVLPYTDWHAMIAEAEASMEPSERASKYDPPPPPDQKKNIIRS